MSEEKQEMVSVSFLVPKPPEGFALRRGVAHVVAENEEQHTLRTMTGEMEGTASQPSAEEAVGLCYAAWVRAEMLLEETIRRAGVARYDREGNEEVRVEPETAE